jgi:hypothetical protein
MVADSVMGLDPLGGSSGVSAEVGLGKYPLALKELKKILHVVPKGWMLSCHVFTSFL